MDNHPAGTEKRQVSNYREIVYIISIHTLLARTVICPKRDARRARKYSSCPESLFSVTIYTRKLEYESLEDSNIPTHRTHSHKGIILVLGNNLKLPEEDLLAEIKTSSERDGLDRISGI